MDNLWERWCLLFEHQNDQQTKKSLPKFLNQTRKSLDEQKALKHLDSRDCSQRWVHAWVNWQKRKLCAFASLKTVNFIADLKDKTCSYFHDFHGDNWSWIRKAFQPNLGWNFPGLHRQLPALHGTNFSPPTNFHIVFQRTRVWNLRKCKPRNFSEDKLC